MKRILFDLYNAQPSGTSKFHGGGEYIKAVFENLVNKFYGECEIIVYFDKDKFIDDWILELIEQRAIKTYDIKKEVEISEIFKNEKIDIFYSGLPYQLKEWYIPKNVYKIGTIHGLRNIEKCRDKYIYLYAEKYRYFKNLIKRLIKYEEKKYLEEYLERINNLDKIICVSKHTKYSICNYYPQISTDKIEVFYTPEKKYNKSTITNNQSKYVLLLGGDRWIKNSYRAIKALDSLFDDNKLKDYKVKIVGGLNYKIVKKIRNINKFEILGYVETEELENLYNNCDFFIYPTLNEGFGMPPLEAMKYGKTCIVSAVTSLPEVCGNAVYYVNPYDIYEIRNRILRASEEKIDKDIIEKQFNKINKKQKEDLDKLCELIINAN